MNVGVNKIMVELPIYRAHRAVVFAIAQLSCFIRDVIRNDVITDHLRKRYNILSNKFGKLKRVVIIFVTNELRRN